MAYKQSGVVAARNCEGQEEALQIVMEQCNQWLEERE